MRRSYDRNSRPGIDGTPISGGPRKREPFHRPRPTGGSGSFCRFFVDKNGAVGVDGRWLVVQALDHSSYDLYFRPIGLQSIMVETAYRGFLLVVFAEYPAADSRC